MYEFFCPLQIHLNFWDLGISFAWVWIQLTSGEKIITRTLWWFINDFRDIKSTTHIVTHIVYIPIFLGVSFHSVQTDLTILWQSTKRGFWGISFYIFIYRASPWECLQSICYKYIAGWRKSWHRDKKMHAIKYHISNIVGIVPSFISSFPSFPLYCCFKINGCAVFAQWE